MRNINLTHPHPCPPPPSPNRGGRGRIKEGVGEVRLLYLVIPLILLTSAGSCVLQEEVKKEGGYRVVIADPSGDDKGDGGYKYPTDAAFVKGSYDILQFIAEERGDKVSLSVKIRTDIENPWDLELGWSLQTIDVYIDTGENGDGKVKAAIGGRKVELSPGWDVAVVIGPEPEKIRRELAIKSPDLVDKVIVADEVIVGKDTLTALIPTRRLPRKPNDKWGYQVFMLSTDSFPTKDDVRIRTVSEEEGQYNFGGGSYGGKNPNVIDIVMPPGVGRPEEIDDQYKALSSYKGRDSYAAVPIVYPALSRGA
jgi:carbohydrate-binding DOMON domain-containing protein